MDEPLLDFGAPLSDVTVTGPTGAPRFDGADYVASRDDVRLTGQLKRIWDVLVDGSWRTLQELHQVRHDVAELGERIDFAERLLAKGER